MSSDRDRLIELLDKAFYQHEEFCLTHECVECKAYGVDRELCELSLIADHLLANGVIVPPCKVEQTLYVKWRLTKASKYGIYPAKVYALRWDDKKNNFRVCVEGKFQISTYGGYYTHYYRATFGWDNVGKTVFLTKEEAEAELRKRGVSNAEI